MNDYVGMTSRNSFSQFFVNLKCLSDDFKVLVKKKCKKFLVGWEESLVTCFEVPERDFMKFNK